MRKPRILIIGKAVMTFTSLTERVPDAGETLVSEGDFFFSPGGKGANAALCAARLGADAVLLARIGGDAYGKELTGIFEKESVDTRFLFADSEKKTALAQIFREPDGNNRTTFFPGASVGLSVDNAEEAFTCYPDALYLSNSVDPEIVYYAVGKAHEQKIPVFFDLSPVCKTLDPSSVGVCEIMTASEDAAAFYTGVAPTSAENLARRYQAFGAHPFEICCIAARQARLFCIRRSAPRADSGARCACVRYKRCRRRVHSLPCCALYAERRQYFRRGAFCRLCRCLQRFKKRCRFFPDRQGVRGIH